MTLQELSQSVSNNPTPALIYLLAIPIIAFGMGLIDKDYRPQSPWRYIYSVLIYAISIPGIFAIMLVLYTFLFENGNLKQVELITHFLPIVCMITTLVTISKEVDLRYVPGFDRLSALMMIIAVTFAVMFVLHKTRIWMVFSGSIQHLLIFFAVLFVVFYFAWNKLIKTNSTQQFDEPHPFK